MPASALDKVVTFVASLLRKELPTLIKPEATLGDRVDWRTSGRPEELHARNQKEAKDLLISSLMKQVLEISKQIDNDQRFETSSNTLHANTVQKSS